MRSGESNGRRCVFCESTENKMSGEHVIPEWIRPYLAGDEPGTHHRVTLKGQGEIRQTWDGQPATQEVRRVCEPCNNGWMSDLESEAKPLLLPMIRGQFHAGGLPLISRWAVKTSLVVASAFNKPPLPSSFYGNFYSRRKPYPGTRIWMGAANRPRLHYVDHRPMEIVMVDEEPPGTYRGYASTIAVGCLCLYVLASEVGQPLSHYFGRKFHRAFEPIWPITGPSKWPPPLLIDGIPDLDSIADTVPPPGAQGRRPVSLIG